MVLTTSLLLGVVLFSFVIGVDEAYAQQTSINVNATTPCFLNSTAGVNSLANCKADEDWLDWIVAPWDWITGGNFSGMIVALMIIGTYLKFGSAINAVVVGIIFLPISFFVFPVEFVSFAVILAFIAIGMLIAYIYVRQTKT